jgi:hypothetical protein
MFTLISRPSSTASILKLGLPMCSRINDHNIHRLDETLPLHWAGAMESRKMAA